MSLSGAEEYYASIRERQKPSYAEKLVEQANTRVSIFDVLEDFFRIYVPREGLSWKSHCPWSDLHPDGGVSKGFRTYPETNSAMCFVQCGYLTPVRLIARKYHEPEFRSARRLLSFYGVGAPLPWKERWASLSDEPEVNVGNPQNIFAALSQRLQRLPAYRSRQFDPDVTTALGRIHGSLESVLADHPTPQRLQAWLDGAFDALVPIIERGSDHHAPQGRPTSV